MPPPPIFPVVQNRGLADCAVDHVTAAYMDTQTLRGLDAAALKAGVLRNTLFLTALFETLAGWSEDPCFSIELISAGHGLPQATPDKASDRCLLIAQDMSQPQPFAQRCAKVQCEMDRLLTINKDRNAAVIQRTEERSGHHGAAVAPVTLTVSSSTFEGAAGQLPIFTSEAPPIEGVNVDFSDAVDGGANICWHYIKEIFSGNVISDMQSAFVRMLKTIALTPGAEDQPADPILPSSQVAVIARVNQTSQPLFTGTLIAPMLDVVKQHPNKCAVTSADGRQLTYQDLFLAAWQYSREIRQIVPEETNVPVLLSKGIEQIIAVYAILMAGCRYVPVDPAQGHQRIQQILSQIEAPLALIETAALQSLCRDMGCDTIQVRDQDLAASPTCMLDRQLDTARQKAESHDADQPGYIIFTSGSTGTPKGVVISHAGASNTCSDINTRYLVGPADRVFAISELTFDLSVYDVFGIHATGGALILPDINLRKDPGHWLEQLNGQNVTIWNSAPALMVMLVEYCEVRNILLPPSLRLVLLSGDWIAPDLAARLHRLAPSAKIISMGGATEASIWSISYEIDPNKSYSPSIPYGRALANQTFHVFDSRMRERPVGVTGDLYIGGKGLAIEYFRNLELTAHHFIQHPKTGERLYRTGDLGCWLADGNIQFQGRQDQQVKVQGFRIELGEIEDALMQHPDVKQAVVLSLGNVHQSKKLAAFWVSDRGDLTSEFLSQWLRDRLPAYMVPGCACRIDALPLSANGKVDRKALQLMQPDQSPPPQQVNKDIELIADLYSESLGVPYENPDVSFFEMGGTSLELARLQNAIISRLGIEVSMVDLLQHGTATALAKHVKPLAMGH